MYFLEEQLKKRGRLGGHPLRSNSFGAISGQMCLCGSLGFRNMVVKCWWNLRPRKAILKRQICTNMPAFLPMVPSPDLEMAPLNCALLTVLFDHCPANKTNNPGTWNGSPTLVLQRTDMTTMTPSVDLEQP